jgi:hypothetical protein
VSGNRLLRDRRQVRRKPKPCCENPRGCEDPRCWSTIIDGRPADERLVQTDASDEPDCLLERADVFRYEAGLCRAQQLKGFGDCALRRRGVIELERVACFLKTAVGALDVTLQGAHGRDLS